MVLNFSQPYLEIQKKLDLKASIKPSYSFKSKNLSLSGIITTDKSFEGSFSLKNLFNGRCSIHMKGKKKKKKEHIIGNLNYHHNGSIASNLKIDYRKALEDFKLNFDGVLNYHDYYFGGEIESIFDIKERSFFNV